MVFVQQASVEGNERLPMVACKSGSRIRAVLQSSGLCSVNVDALSFYHCKAGVDGLHFGCELFLRDRPRLVAVGVRDTEYPVSGSQ